ncbi:MAG: family 16 glycosylhydrolase [Rhodothermaceae bacterium]|nr:family 16 glycosylhydrolase [Rhodothermaceae bacterium]MXX58675.1 family 16 glycosylhydrolase [Rhodothermaceae bacterium]MYD18515.1 family 16 glycosylhydrolase [Rhodothermaceae bacterium]MYD56004.1 family 16 glycosylhydrolase [Rhodothermaceae bacterium]MYJ56425.1 family 16 glycosylhydrolase [Rhodothermaceae bacterium]
MRTGHSATSFFVCLLVGVMPVPNLLAQSSWELIWNDEFDYTGLPDSTRWSYDVGGHGWGNQEDQFYTENREENARADGDHLIIEARKEDWRGRSYTSARLVSKHKGDWTYGRIEVRAQLPSGRGTWPAIWMLPTNSHYGNGGWPDTGEIDIMEHVGFDQDLIHATIHTDAYNHMIGTQRGGSKRVTGASDNFHVYAVEWSPRKMVFSIDGVDFWTYSKGLSNWQGWPFDLDFHLIMNIAIGGAWGGAQGIDDSIFPQQMLIDHVRVYRYIDFPQVTLAAPATLEAGETAVITGTSVDPDGRILRVNLYQDDGLLETITGGASEWSWSTSNVSAGCYKLRAEATDDGGWIGSTDVQSLTVGNSCTGNAPYLMSPHPIQDRIEAEYFDLGGPGVAYRDLSPTNEGGGIRLHEGVDVFPTTDGAGYHIGNTARREWVTYTVHVDQAGIYDLQVRLASQANQVSFSLEFDGVDKIGVFTHQSPSDDFRTVRVITEDGIALEEGIQIMKLQFFSGVPKVNWLKFRLRSPTDNMTKAGIELSEMADGSAVTTLSVDEAGSQTYYVKLTSEPSADVKVAISGHDGTDLMLDNDGDASTDFSELTFTMENWNAAQAVMMTAAVDGDGDDDIVTLMHTASSSDMAYDSVSVNLEVTVTDVTQTNFEDANELPKEIALDQNFPNPFNPSTSIRFALPESETVTLRVYDTLGRPAATLLDQKPHTAGTHTVRFDGAGLASGVYLYRLEVGASVLMTRYMQLIK